MPDDEFIVEELIGIQNHIGWCGVFNARHGSNYTPISAVKPILRPLSDLFDSSNKVYGNIFLLTDESTLIYYTTRGFVDLSEICYDDINTLIQNHFDVFGMIKSNEAININDL